MTSKPTNQPVEAPLVFDAPDNADWHSTCDVLVVGLGAAGAATAISACEAGANVQVVDRQGLGGATARSGGIIYAGGGTVHQQKAGYEDTPDEMFNYLRQETGDAVSETTLRRFCADSRDLIGWLESIGVSFDSDVPPPKTSYPKDGCYLYFSGNEKIRPFADAAKPAPRGHRVRDKGLSGGRLFSLLRARVDALGIPVMAPASVRRLITNNAGAVIGAEVHRIPPNSSACRQYRRLTRIAEAIHNFAPGPADWLRHKALQLELTKAETLHIRATRGVTLTTGGFIFNPDMVAQHTPAYVGNMRIGTAGCDGSGIRLGQSVGGAADRLHKASAWRFINPPQALTHGAVVDERGKRFCHEGAYGARLGVAMCEDHNGKAWLILDKSLRRAALRQCLFGRLWAFQSLPAIVIMLFAKRARTVSALARRVGIAVEPLAATINHYNVCARGEDADPHCKSGAELQAIETAPFYALNISAHNPLFPCATLTLGGLRVDETSSAVLDADNQHVEGLYAAGRAAVGIASNNYVSGLSLADCLWSGRRAGAAIAARPHTTT